MTEAVKKISLEEAHALVADSSWLKLFPEDLRENLLAISRLLPPLDRGERIYNVGDVPDGIYCVVSGCFGFEIALREEGPHLIHQYRPGSWFGALAFVLGRPRLAAMFATRPSQCLVVPGHALDSLLRNDGRLWRFMALSLASDSELALTAINDLMLRSPKSRLVASLLRLAGFRIDDAAHGESLQLDLTHATLAALTNISRSKVAQCLQELEEDGCLEYRYGKIILVDTVSLREWLRVSSE